MSKPVKIPEPRPKLMLFGDPHGDFRYPISSVERWSPEAVILLGDVQARRPLEIELAPILDLTSVWFIHGNHDTDSDADHDHLFGSALAHRNLHGRVVEIAGLRVAGLGGVFRETIWSPPLEPVFRTRAERLRRIRPSERWRGGIPLRHRSSIWPDDFERLSRMRADVLVTHEAPGGHRHGWPVLDDLATAMGVGLLAHGHLHKQIDYSAEGRLPAGCRYQAHGVAPEAFLVWPPIRSVRPGGAS
jgi:predicted phosphodiesterase